MDSNLADNGRWVYSKRIKGLALFAQQPDGTLKPVPSNKPGEFVTKPYEKLAGEEYKPAIRAERSRRFQKLIKAARTQI